MPTRFLEPASEKHNGGSSRPPGTARAPPQQPVVPAVSSTALKLSIGGVDFCLLPSTSGNGYISLEAAMDNTEAVVSLRNFTGTLRVVCTGQVVGNAGSAAAKNNSNNLVEDSASPSTENEGNHKRKGQISTPDALEVVAASRSSPPLKRSRKSKDYTSNENTASKQKNTVSPQAGKQQKSASPSSISDASSQTRQLPSNGSKQTTEERIVDIVSGKDVMIKHDEEDNESVATRMADDTEIDDNHIADKEEEEETDKRSNHTCLTNMPLNSQSQLSITVEDDSSDNDIEIATDVALVESNGADSVSTAITTQVVTPSPRWGHTLTWCEHNRILLYGGQSYLPNKQPKKKSDGEVFPTTMSDVHIFDVDKQKWFQPINCDDKTRQWPRQWHSATFLPSRQLLICFGGEQTNPKSGRVTTSDKDNLMVLDTEILLWYPPRVSGDIPSGRSGHSATLLPSSSNNELVLFGGVKNGRHLNSVAVLDTNRWIWSTPKIQGVAPKARSYHSATAIQAAHVGSTSDGTGGYHTDHVSNSKNATINIRHRIVFFGGNDTQNSFNAVSVLEKIEGATNTWRWFHPTVIGKPPKPRTGHSGTLLADQKTICIYGGWDPMLEENEGTEIHDPIYQDSFLLDTDSWTWKMGSSSPAFAGHSMDPSQGNDGGSRRTGHAALLNTTANNDIGPNNEILIFGGQVPGDQFAGDFQTLTIS